MWSLSRPQASSEIDLSRPLGMVDERITISLSLEDRLVAMSLVVIHREVLVPFEERGETIFRILFRCAVDLARVSQEKIQRRSRNRPFPPRRARTDALPVCRTRFAPLRRNQGSRSKAYCRGNCCSPVHRRRDDADHRASVLFF